MQQAALNQYFQQQTGGPAPGLGDVREAEKAQDAIWNQEGGGE
jgi:hypothetical protein